MHSPKCDHNVYTKYVYIDIVSYLANKLSFFSFSESFDAAVLLVKRLDKTEFCSTAMFTRDRIVSLECATPLTFSLSIRFRLSPDVVLL